MADEPKKLRVFTDTNVLLSGNAFPRWPYEVLRHAARGDFQLVLCPVVIDEARRHMSKRWPAYLPRLEKFLREAEYELVPDPASEEIDANKNLVRDFSDVAIALVAISASVDYLVSEDKDLTVQDETTAELRQHLQVMLSGTFLREVMGWTSKALEAIRRRRWDEVKAEENKEESE